MVPPSAARQDTHQSPSLRQPAQAPWNEYEMSGPYADAAFRAEPPSAAHTPSFIRGVAMSAAQAAPLPAAAQIDSGPADSGPADAGRFSQPLPRQFQVPQPSSFSSSGGGARTVGGEPLSNAPSRVTFALPSPPPTSAVAPAETQAALETRIERVLTRIDALETAIQQLSDEAHWFYGLVDGDASRKCVVHADPPAPDGSISDPIREVSGGKWLRLSYPKLVIETAPAQAGAVPTSVATWFCVHTVDKYGDCMQVWICNVARDGQPTFKKFTTAIIPSTAAPF